MDNYYRLVLPAVAGSHKMVPISALVTDQVTLRALRNAVQRGRLVALRGADGVWRSSRRNVDAYVNSRYKRVPGASAASRPPAAGGA
ncbi:MAG: hypothetical protein JOZ75_09955 [Candidatus Dormibacteraeota bacterium]|nr:hypothetical protein [Candidatus Dormibacteraeota bacterium]